jgi:redox-sensitive bicupin YhaK (pirin superfamily)
VLQYQAIFEKEADWSSIDTVYPSDGVQITIISGESHGKTGFVRPVGGCWYFDFRLSKPGVEVFQPLPEGWTGLVYSEYRSVYTSTSYSD